MDNEFSPQNIRSSLPRCVAISMLELRQHMTDPVPCILTIMFGYDNVFHRVIFTGNKEEDDITVKQLEEKYFSRLF